MLRGVDGVKDVVFEKDTHHYNSASALFEVTFDGEKLDEISIQGVKNVRAALDGYDTYITTEIGNPTGEILEREMRIVLIILMCSIFVVLLLTSHTYAEVPVLILTAREEEADKVSGLEIGADDYITKPFSMQELIARVGANIRRTAMNTAAAATAAATAMPVAGDLSIDTDSHQVFRDGKPLELTTREYELLTFLASHPNKVYSRIDLMEQVWNYGYVGDDQRTVDVTVRRLREKIEENPASPKYILTRRGVGYYFAV